MVSARWGRSGGHRPCGQRFLGSASLFRVHISKHQPALSIRALFLSSTLNLPLLQAAVQACARSGRKHPIVLAAAAVVLCAGVAITITAAFLLAQSKHRVLKVTGSAHGVVTWGTYLCTWLIKKWLGRQTTTTGLPA